MRFQGSCYVVLAYDIGLQTDLNACANFLRETPERIAVMSRPRAPKHFEYRERPLRIKQSIVPLQVNEFASVDTVDLTLYEFGAVSLRYRFPFNADLSKLIELSEALCDNPALACDSLLRVKELLAAITPAVAKPGIAGIGEDYLIFDVLREDPHADVHELLREYRCELAQVLRAEREELSPEEIEITLRGQVSYSPGDLAIVDWDAAFLYGRDAEDVHGVLELANVQLLEMRLLDARLQKDLDTSYELLSKQRRHGTLFTGFNRRLHYVGRLQVDSALLFEGVSNALKLFGDQYLARLYRLAAVRFHLDDWDGNIQRKLNALGSIYQKLADMGDTARSQLLEFIIVVLILFEIVMSFV